MAYSRLDKNRRDIQIPQSRVGEVLPSYFEADNPKLITLLEKYYDFLDSDGKHGFSSSIREIALNRDAEQNSTEALDELVKEIGNGLTSAAFFDEPRLMAKLLGQFYRVKGTLTSVEGFFRGFFGEEVVVEYPKDQIFIVGESNIGFESQKFIQNNALYQIFSVLLKTGLSTSDYDNLYKKFVHPAGWFFQGEVSTATEITLFPSSLASGDSIRPDLIASPGDASTTVFGPETFIFPSFEFNEITALIADSSQNQFRIRLDQLISTYQDISAEKLGQFYTSIDELLTPNSFTFDNQTPFDTTYDGAAYGESSTSNYAADSAGHEDIFFLANTFAPYANLNTHIAGQVLVGSIGVYWNDTTVNTLTDSYAAPASALLGPERTKTILYIDSSNASFDANNFVNPEHLNAFNGLAFNSGANRSQHLPGLLIKGTALDPPDPDYYYRVDSDAYYIRSALYPAAGDGTWSTSIGNRFAISKLRLGDRLGSEAAPDFSLTFETMDNDMFTRYSSDSTY